MRLVLAALFLASAPAAAFDVKPGQELTVNRQMFGVHAVTFRAVAGEPAELQVDLDILPAGRELKDGRAERVTAAVCRTLGLDGTPPSVLGILAEKVSITLYTVKTEGGSTERSGQARPCA